MAFIGPEPATLVAAPPLAFDAGGGVTIKTSGLSEQAATAATETRLEIRPKRPAAGPLWIAGRLPLAGCQRLRERPPLVRKQPRLDRRLVGARLQDGDPTLDRQIGRQPESEHVPDAW